MASGSVGLVFDENFSRHQVGFVDREAKLGTIRHVRDLSWSGKPDKVWIPLAVSAGFVIVTGDRNDKTREYTVEDLKALGARVILVSEFWDHMKGWPKAKWLVESIERIYEIASSMTEGTVVLIDRNCKVKTL